MNEKFFDLSREKQDRMINGAVEVFAKNGFKHASTDDMVKAVGVSKGLWFHYFGSKLGLYNFVYGYSVKYVILELSSILDAEERDYFEVVKQMEFTNMRIKKKYPYMLMFLAQAKKEKDAEVRAQIAEDQTFFEEKWNGFLKNADIQSIEEKTQREKVKKLVQYTIQGILGEQAYDESDPETVYKEIRNQIDFIKDMVQEKTASEDKEEKVSTVAS